MGIAAHKSKCEMLSCIHPHAIYSLSSVFPCYITGKNNRFAILDILGYLKEEEEEPLLIYTAQGSPFRRKKLSVINGSPEQQRTKTTLNI